MDKNFINNNNNNSFIDKIKSKINNNLVNNSQLNRSELIGEDFTPNISLIKRQINDKLLLSEEKIIQSIESLLPIQTTPKMSSRREVNALKSDFKQSIGKSGKRTPTPTKHLDASQGKKVTKSVGRPRSRSRSRTPTRKSTTRTVTPRVSSSKKDKKKESNKPTKSKASTPSTPTRSALKPSTSTSTSNTSTSKRKTGEDSNDKSAKKAKTSEKGESLRPTTPGTRRSLRLQQTPRSDLKVRNTVPKTVTFDGQTDNNQTNNNQSRGWLSYCSVM